MHSVSQPQQEAIDGTLTDLFGTPDTPKVPADVHLDLSLLQRAAGPVAGDAAGRRRGLYRQHCAGCHGISGDGAGPMAAMLDPYPRDFRNGVFKWKSTKAGAKPTRDDLLQILRRGIPGTAMPSFLRLSDEDQQALIEYVKYLTIRGETERVLIALVMDENESLPDARERLREEGLRPAAQAWDVVEEHPEQYAIQPPPEPPVETYEQRMASITLGKQLFTSKNAQCVKCHGPEGRGNGTETELYDDWNKPKKGTTAAETAAWTARYSLPLQRIRPRNFHEGVFRGGSRPEDLFARIDGGIPGTPMPAAGPAGGTAGVLTPEEIWHVVHYLKSLSGR